MKGNGFSPRPSSKMTWARPGSSETGLRDIFVTFFSIVAFEIFITGMHCVCWWLVQYAAKDDDTLEDIRRKSFLPHWFTLLCVEGTIAAWWSLGYPVHPGTLAVDGMFLSTLLGILFVLKTKTCPLWTNEAVFSWHVIMVIMLDWANSATMEETWQFVILATDSLLLVGCRDTPVTILTAITVLWLMVRTAEEMLRFGLMDAVPLTESTVGGCKLPPEALGVSAKGFNRLVSRVLVFVMDLGFTRGFATGMKNKTEKLQQAIELAHSIARALGRFDLEEATKLVMLEKDIDDDLAEAFMLLVDNLKIYEPYLPQALFEDRRDSHSHSSRTTSDAVEVLPPMGTVAIVFTDVQGSTSLWEASSSAMDQALRLHNRLFRECIARFDGYEVKTIGDAFMITWQELEKAALFCLQAQESLLEEDWPTGLYHVPSYEKVYDDEGLLWNGLRVRMGLHYGDATVETNPITGRADYFGPNINKASRVESVSRGGAIGISEEVIQNLDMSKVGNPYVMGPYVRELKGIGKQDVYALLPKALSGRKAHCKLDVARVRRQSTALSATTDRHENKENFKASCTLGSLCMVRVIMRNGESPTQLGEMLEILVESSDRTQGLVLAMIGCQLCVSWNGSGVGCASHTTHAIRFSKVVAGVLHNNVALGVCTGPMAHMSIGGGRRRFVVSVGWCEQLAQKLCDISLTTGKAVLCAGVPGFPSPADDTSVASHLRFVAHLDVDDSDELIPIYECSTVNDDSSVWGTFDAPINEVTPPGTPLKTSLRANPCTVKRGYIVELVASAPNVSPHQSLVPDPILLARQPPQRKNSRLLSDNLVTVWTPQV